MNERIKELYGRALDKAVPYTWHNLDHVEVEKVVHEFTDLIIEECVRKVSNLMDYTDYDDPEKSMVELKTLNDARQVIKEHFGVK